MIKDVIDRLDAAKIFKHTGGAAGFVVASETKPSALPAAYVLPLNIGAEKNGKEGGVSQRINPAFGIAIAVSNVSDPKGAAALIDREMACDSVMKALLGWVPRIDCEPMEYGGGALLSFKNGVLWWQEIYSTKYLIQS